MVHRRELGGEVLVFGNQGALWGNAMTWWDHGTGSVWSQPLGEAIVGPREGDKLDLMASQLTSWGTWRDQHTDTLALDAPGGDTRFDLEEMTIVVDFSEEVGVYPIEELVDEGPANDIVAGVPVAVAIDPASPDRWSVFHRRVDERLLTLAVVGEDLIDEETGSVWDVASGRAIEGPLTGEILDQLPGFTSFERDARTFWPEARFWDG